MVTKIGKYQHIETGSVIVHSTEKVTLTLDKLTFELIFIDNPAIKETKLEASGGGLNLILTFQNFNSGLGHVNKVPLPIGTLNSKKLYLNYVVYGFGTPNSIAKLVHYTFMLEENG